MKKILMLGVVLCLSISSMALVKTNAGPSRIDTGSTCYPFVIVQGERICLDD